MASERFSCEACSKWFEFDTAEGENLGDAMVCPFCDLGEAKRVPDKSCCATGRYKYSRKLARMVKVSDVTPGLAGGGGCAGCASGSCGSCGCH